MFVVFVLCLTTLLACGVIRSYILAHPWPVQFAVSSYSQKHVSKVKRQFVSTSLLQDAIYKGVCFWSATC